MMARPIAIAPITTPELSPPDMIAVAARTGYSHVGLRMRPSVPGGFAWPLASNAGLLRETQARLRDTGVGVLDVDIIRLNEASKPASFKPMLEIGARLGALCVLVAADDTDFGRLAANFAALCDLAAPNGLSIDIEFMPWTAVRNLADAERLMRAVDQPNAGILVDTLHVDRSDTPIADLVRLPRQWLHYMQICDAPAEKPGSVDAMIHCARAERLFPGEGGLDLRGMLDALPTDLPISVEVPRETMARTVGAEQRAAMALEATRSFLSILGGGEG